MRSIPVSPTERAGTPVRARAQAEDEQDGLQAPAGAGPALLEVQSLGVAFRSAEGRTVQAVDGVDLALAPEQTLALVGESGSGKSVTALAIMGLLPARSARIAPQSQIRFAGESLLESDGAGAVRGSEVKWRSLRGRRIAMIFQDPLTSLNPVYTVGFQLAEMLRLHRGMGRLEAMRRAQALLEEVGIPEPERRIHAHPHELSGGQQQRVMIAMAIACEPDLLIADEPTTALDVTIQRQILELLLALKQRRRMAILFITHDLGLVGEFADAVVVMRNGKVREAGSVAKIFGAPADVYTRALIHCRPDAKSPAARLLTIDDWSSTQAAANQPYEVESSPQPVLSPAILEVRHLRKVFIRRAGLFGRNDLVAVDDLSFSLARGKTIGIVGESGSGKTTAGLCIVRLHPASAGEVIFDGTNLLALSGQQLFAIRRRLQIVFQNPYASLNPRFTIAEILAEPIRLHHLASGAAECNARVRKLLDRVGLPASSLNRYPHEFSGGQRQRIAIARCLALEPEVIVCDEAVSALDVSVQAQVLNLLKDLQRDLGLSYVFISHDLAVVRHMADELLVMLAGKVVEQGDAGRIYRAPAHAYTRALLDAVPRGYDPQRGVCAPGGAEAAVAHLHPGGEALVTGTHAGRKPHA